MTDGLEQAAWSWTEHLRAGGSQPWSQWLRAPDAGDSAVPEGWTPPGAAQLEVVRRAVVVTGRALPASYVDLVLARSGPARGLAVLPLGWPGITGTRSFGPPRTDPADVPEEELIRVGVGALTDLLLRSTDPDPSEWRVRRPLLRREPAFELAGPPVSTTAVRRALATRGHVEGGRPSRVALIVGPFDAALLDVWSARVQRGAAARWRGFVARAAHRLPHSIDFSGLAQAWSERVGPAHVHVVVAPPDPDDAARLVADGLCLPERSAHSRPPVAPPPLVSLPPAALDVLRRVNAVLAVKAAEGRHAGAARRLSVLLSDLTAQLPEPQATLTVPRPFQDWVMTRSERLVEDVRRRGYPVHGDLARVVPAFDDVPTRPGRAGVLRLVLEAGVRLAAAEGQSPTEEERHR